VRERGIHLTRALLVEGNPLWSSVTVAQLRDIGIGSVIQASRVKDARLLIERERFDFIVCNREFEGASETGQDLLDELRRERQLPHSTVFLMVTSQASYHQVVEAAESALDGILVRPYTAALLNKRLMAARKRKHELAEILQALDQGKAELALEFALRRFRERLPYADYCGRLAAELLLSLGKHSEARLLFEGLAHDVDSTWAKLGVARAHTAAGETLPALRLLQAVVAADPTSADAHDLLGRTLVEQGDFEGALRAYRQAAALTPGCLMRRQHVGTLAFYQGLGDEALPALESALALGEQSKLFDALSLVLIGALRHDSGDASVVSQMRQQIEDHQTRSPESRRLARFAGAADMLLASVREHRAEMHAALQLLGAQVAQDDFDLEAANIVLLLWARMPEDARSQAPYFEMIEAIAERFCVSRAITEVLIASARRLEPAVALVRAGHSKVSALAEHAMDLALNGEPGQAVRVLIEQGSALRNARLLELARTIARRNQAQLEEATALIAEVASVLALCCPSPLHLAGIQRSGRSPAALQWMTVQPRKAPLVSIA